MLLGSVLLNDRPKSTMNAIITKTTMQNCFIAGVKMTSRPVLLTVKCRFLTFVPFVERWLLSK